MPWDQRYAGAGAIPEPASVLRDNLHLLPSRGRAMDLACGLGANALLLAGQGLDVTAWDLSEVAVTRLRQHADLMQLRVDAQVRDLCARPPEPESFDCIVVAHFLDRGLAPAIAEALRPGGLLFYQTFSLEGVSDRGPSNSTYRLGTNELLRLFPGLTLRFYREEGRLGDLTRGTRDLVQLVAERPPAAAEPGSSSLPI
jgi:2-polyprenyl-3-methyl-5-hydroxy-6-metoxy-1,4-benzoquinol methylase